MSTADRMNLPRGAALVAGALAVAVALAACGDTSENSASGSGVVTETVYVTSSAEPSAGCKAPVIAIDPGHNPVHTEQFDPVTGAAMIDYSNGQEDIDAMAVSKKVKAALAKQGYTAVLLKKSVDEDVSYRERVSRAEEAGADLAVSVHTDVNHNAVFVQRVGLYREGTGADGQTVRIAYKNTETAAKSQKYGKVIAEARSKSQGVTVEVRDNDFGGRPPLWSGNIPIIMLISEEVPWVYNEFGLPGRGGSYGIGAAGVETYAAGLASGLQQALPNRCRS